jgi:cytidine deaminase
VESSAQTSYLSAGKTMSNDSPLTSVEKEALAAARAAQQRAYAPYSGRRVGAAVITSSGRVFAACNVENKATEFWVCAERNAIAAAIASGENQLETVIVVAPDGRFWPPCASCRQVIAEFAPAAEIIMSNESGATLRASLDKLQSRPFDAGDGGEET